MAANPIQKPRCSTCPHRFTYLESISRREGGVNLQFGREYCKGGKKYRVHAVLLHEFDISLYKSTPSRALWLCYKLSRANSRYCSHNQRNPVICLIWRYFLFL